MTIVFSYNTDIKIINIWEYMYMYMFIIINNIILIHTVVLVNLLHCKKTEKLINAIEMNKVKYYLAWLHPFNLMQFTIFTLFTTHTLHIYLNIE